MVKKTPDQLKAQRADRSQFNKVVRNYLANRVQLTDEQNQRYKIEHLKRSNRIGRMVSFNPKGMNRMVGMNLPPATIPTQYGVLFKQPLMAPSGLLFSDRGRKDLKAAVKMAHKGNVTARDAIADLNEMNGFYNTALAELAKVGSKDEQRDERYEEIRKKYNESKSNHEEIERVANKRFYIYNPSKHNNLQNTKLVFSKYSRAKTGVMKGYYPEKEKKPRKARGLPAAAIGQLLQNAPADEEPAQNERSNVLFDPKAGQSVQNGIFQAANAQDPTASQSKKIIVPKKGQPKERPKNAMRPAFAKKKGGK